MAVISLAFYQGYQSVMVLASTSKAKTEAVALANEQIEIIRNLPYSDVGIKNGLPSGKLAHESFQTRGNILFKVTTTIRNIDDPFDGQIGGTPNDTAPADYKLAEVVIDCSSCKNYQPIKLTTTVAPKNLENSSAGGALFVRVFDASGQPVTGANVRVENLSSSLLIEDVTNSDGVLQLVDVPPGNLTYKVTVSKSGYSTARTYAPGEAGIANPVDSHATVAVGEVTQLSLSIDRLSTLKISATNKICQPLGPFSFQLKGTKVLGHNPEVFKYDQVQSLNSSGLLNLSNIEWDTYNFLPNDFTYDIVGSFPLLIAAVSPGSVSEVSLVLGLKNPKGLLVSVKDAATGLPLSGAAATLSGVGYSEILETNQGFLTQTDWSGGAGQIQMISSNRYYQSDGHIETVSPTGELKLTGFLGTYNNSGNLESSLFDTGSASTTYYNLKWSPTDQPLPVGSGSVKFQLASGNDPEAETWNFLGPDGTSGSYYTLANTNINSVHNNHRYIKYRVYLATDDVSVTPNLSDISLTYSSECIPYGQVYFGGLDLGPYVLSVSKLGYQEASFDVLVSSDWQVYEVTLSPQ